MAKQRRITPKPVYTSKESFCAYLVTGWFTFGLCLFYLALTQPAGKNALPDFLSLFLLSLFMASVFPTVSVLYSSMNFVGALADGDYGRALLNCAFIVGIVLIYQGIRYVLYGIERSGVGNVP